MTRGFDSRTAAVVCGASAYPRAPELSSNVAFRNSYRQVTELFRDADLFGIDAEDLLDLFDSDDPSQVQLEAIKRFLRERRERIHTLIFYYIGHGGFRDGYSEYYLACKQTDGELPFFTSIPLAHLAGILKQNFPRKQKFILIDACFSGSAAGVFHQALDEEASRQSIRSLSWDDIHIGDPQSLGTALLTSSSSIHVSSYEDGKHTFFSNAIYKVLSGGVTNGPSKFSLNELHSLVIGQLRLDRGDLAPKPEVHVPEQVGGRLNEVPFFRNKRYIEVPRGMTLPEHRIWRRGSTSTVLGVDFGTSTSLVGAYHTGNAHIILNRFGKKSTPTIAAVDYTGKLIYGEAATALSAIAPQRSIRNFKRGIEREKCASIDGRDYQPVEVAGGFLKYILDQAVQNLNVEIESVVATVPAYYTRRQRLAIRDAYELAGYPVYRMLLEPCAAAMAHGFRSSIECTIAACDLGGGTFDVAILDMSEGLIEVLVSAGDAHLGGIDFDRCIGELMLRDGTRGRASFDTLQVDERERLLREAEQIKIALSEATEIPFTLGGILNDPDAASQSVTLLGRGDFEASARALLIGLRSVCRFCEQSPNVGSKRVEQIIPIGLSTYIPAVRRTLRDVFCADISIHVEPDEAVVRGAAIQAGVLSGLNPDQLLLHSVPYSIQLTSGVGADEEVFVLTEATTIIPTRSDANFLTQQPGQLSALFFVWEFYPAQGTRELSGYILVRGIRSASNSRGRFTVRVDIDANEHLEFFAVSDDGSPLECSLLSELPEDLLQNGALYRSVSPY